MLKVSGLFILLCGLFGSSTAQMDLPQISKGLLGGGLLPSQQLTNLQDSTKELSNSVSPLEFEVQPTNQDSNIVVQVKDLQILQDSLELSPDKKGAKLKLPWEFISSVIAVGIKVLVFPVRTDTEVELYAEKNADGEYRLAFNHCRLKPESLDILTKNNIGEETQRNMKILLTNHLGAKICHIINSWLYNLKPQLTNELLNLVLQQGTYQPNI